MTLTGVAVFLVVAACILLAYFLVGSLVRYRKGLRSFPEVLPNYTFWRRIAYLARNGFYFLVSCGKYAPPVAADIAVLPSKPRRDFGFEELPDDMDEFEDYDENGAIGGGAGDGGVVVVRY
jgi:hypothetical protein